MSRTDERTIDELVKDYKIAQAELDNADVLMKADPAIIAADAQIKTLVERAMEVKEAKSKILQRYNDMIVGPAEAISIIERELCTAYDGAHKTINTPHGTVKYRVTKTVHVRHKRLAVEALIKNNLVDEGVQSISKKTLRALTEAGIYCGAELREKLNVSVE